MRFNRVFATSILLLSSFGIAGCSGASEQATSTDSRIENSTSTSITSDADVNVQVASVSVIDTSDVFSDRDLSLDYDKDVAVDISLSDAGVVCDASGVSVTDGIVTISTGGTYVISGSAKNVEIVVDATDEKVELVLDGCKIENDTLPAIFVKSADKVFVFAGEGASELRCVGDVSDPTDEGVDGVVFSRDDLTVCGAGSLSVVAGGSGHGIVCKDDAVVVNCKLSVETQSGSAVQVKGSFATDLADVTINSGKDGIHAEDTDDPSGAWVYIAGGKFDISAKSDGVDAGGAIQIDDGDITLSVVDDGLHSESDFVFNGGNIVVSSSTEGIEGARVTVSGGEASIVSSDDGVNATGDGSADSDVQSNVSDMDQNMSERPPEAEFGTENEKSISYPNQNVETQKRAPMASGEAPSGEVPSGDGSFGVPHGGMGGNMSGMGHGGGGFGNDATASFTMTAGKLTIFSGGDAIDSNGSIDISDGSILIEGPENSGNAIIDYGDGGTARISGGTFVGVGSSGMATNFSESDQGSILVSFSGMGTGEFTVTDDSGNEIVIYTPEKQYQSVLVSMKDFVSGGTYHITRGDETIDVTLDGLVYGQSNGLMPMR